LVRTAFDIAWYQARTSLVSMMAPPASIDLNYKESDLPESEKRHIRGDLDKIWRRKIKIASDAVILDFIDERFGLGALPGSFFTFSTAYRKVAGADALAKCDRFIGPATDEYFRLTKAALPGFCELLQDIPRLIVNDAYWASRKEDGSPFDAAAQAMVGPCNAVLDIIFDEISKRTKATFLNIPKGALFGKVGHRWDDAPFHYSDACEQLIAKRLVGVADSLKAGI
jgi:hypothetical protein